MKTTCPKCKSETTQSFAMAHSSGTSSGGVVGVGMTGDGDIGIARGVSRSQTGVAKLTEPPTDKSNIEFVAVAIFVLGLPIVVLVLTLMFSSITIAVIATLVVFAGVGAAAYNWMKTKLPKHQASYQAAMTRWQHSWICLRCGHTFYVR